MDLASFHEMRRLRAEQQPRFRELCQACLQPTFACYCRHIVRFDPGLKVVVLIHPIEANRRIATGRMSALCLENSDLIMGHDYSNNARVNAILQDERYHSVILYPGVNSANLTPMAPAERAALIPVGKKLAVFVIDGTWHTARQMARLSKNLHGLPRICFSPEKPSNFRVRKQPAPGCVSTIEAIHQTIELLMPSLGVSGRAHDNLLHVFGKMVEQQLTYIPQNHAHPRMPKKHKLRLDRGAPAAP